MKLYTHPRSPFARKVMIFARVHDVTLDEEVVGGPDPQYGYTNGDNPLGKIPALEWQLGQFLFDSPVICEHLDNLSQTPLLPQNPQARFIQKWHHALGDGLAEANMHLMFERLRPKELHWEKMISRHERAVEKAVMHLEIMTDDIGEDWTFGNIGIVTALDFLSFRATQFKWRAAAPKLAVWHDGFIDKQAYQDSFGYGAEL